MTILENIMLTKRSQTQATYCMVPCMWNGQCKKSIEIVVISLYFAYDENVLELNRLWFIVIITQLCEYTKMHSIVYFKRVGGMICKSLSQLKKNWEQEVNVCVNTIPTSASGQIGIARYTFIFKQRRTKKLTI